MPAAALANMPHLLQEGEGTVLRGIPSYIYQTQLFPSLQGVQFIRQWRARHPWQAINQLYQRPPQSTEQILHERKYAINERPVPIVSHPLPALAGYRPLYGDVLGEFQLSLYLSQGVSPHIAQRAAEGWGGDRLEAYQRLSKEDSLVLVHLSSWDSEADAIEFANA
jgi:hypothetical protein